MKKTPVIIQLEELECGAACLGMVLGSYGKWLSLEQLRKDCGVSRDGSKASSIVNAAMHYGCDAEGYRLSVEELQAHPEIYPVIGHWQNRHFLVINKITSKYAYLNDPAMGAVKMSLEEFKKGYSGVVIVIKPNENFVADGQHVSMLSHALSRLKAHPKAVVATVICNVLAAVFSAAGAMLSRLFLDEVLPTHQGLGRFLVFFILFNIFQLVFLTIEELISLKAAGVIASKGASDFMWKVIKLPMEFFSQRSAGDIQRRRDENATITKTFLDTLAPLLIDGFMMIFYFIMMISYSPLLTLIGVVMQGIAIIVCRIASAQIANYERLVTIEDAKLYSHCVSGIEMISNIKATGSEKAYLHKWNMLSSKLSDAQMKELKVEASLGQIPAFIDQLTSIVILISGIYLVGQGKLSLGALMVFQSFLSSFASPITSFMDASAVLHETRTQIERVDDVLKYPKDRIFDFNIQSDTYEKLDGSLSIKDLTFSYGPLAEPVVKNFSLDIKKGESVAFVGGSGCGKSTISSLISGLYAPNEGEIRFGGKLLHDIDPLIFRASLAVVDQDISLFDDTIENNIKMWDDSIEDFEMILAAKDAQIHDEIMSRPEGYKTMIKDNGGNFSGGQCQRIEIARVLAQDPTIVIFDEATSALDAETEYKIVKNIEARGITSIVIAHRLSAIRNCNRIVVLEHGEIKAMGTHKELMENCPLYRELVMNE